MTVTLTATGDRQLVTLDLPTFVGVGHVIRAIGVGDNLQLLFSLDRIYALLHHV